MRAPAVGLLVVLLSTSACDDSGLSMIETPDAGSPAPDAFVADLGTTRDAEPSPDAPAPDAEPLPDAEPPTDAFAPDACSNSNENDQLTVNTPSHVFAGSVTSAVGDGQFVVTEPNGGEVRGTIPTTPAGDYSVELPLFCGTQTVELFWDMGGGCEHRVTIAATRTECAAQDIRVTLTWDALGLDWELHLVKQGGRINDPTTDCTWNTCISSSPDWGVIGDAFDDPVKDVDNTGTYGPENISLSRPENGTYLIMVEHWGTGDPLSSGEVTVNIGGGTTTVVPIIGLPPRHVRYVAEIAWPSGSVNTVGTVYDCSADWLNGCQAAIP